MKKSSFSLLFLCISLAIGAQSLKDVVRSAGSNFNNISNAAEEYFAKKYASNAGVPTTKFKRFEADSGMALYEKVDGEYAKYKRWEWYWKNKNLHDVFTRV